MGKKHDEEKFNTATATLKINHLPEFANWWETANKRHEGLRVGAQIMTHVFLYGK